MQKILVPTDFSKNSLYALKYASELAKIHKAKIFILHVSIMPTYYINDLNNYTYYDKSYQDSINKINNFNELKLKDFSNHVSSEFIQVRLETKLGLSIYYEITNYANKINADLIIMGSHSGNKSSIFNIGSNTERVIRSTKTPVIVIKKQISPEKMKKVIFASEFEKDALKIFPSLNSLIKSFDPEIHLLYINTKSNFKEYSEIKIHILRFMKLFSGNFKIRVRASKNIDEGIIKYANSIKADLITLGVKRHKGISLYLTDRITERVISSTKIPILTIDNPK